MVEGKASSVDRPVYGLVRRRRLVKKPATSERPTPYSSSGASTHLHVPMRLAGRDGSPLKRCRRAINASSDGDAHARARATSGALDEANEPRAWPNTARGRKRRRLCSRHRQWRYSSSSSPAPPTNHLETPRFQLPSPEPSRQRCRRTSRRVYATRERIAPVDCKRGGRKHVGARARWWSSRAELSASLAPSGRLRPARVSLSAPRSTSLPSTHHLPFLRPPSLVFTHGLLPHPPQDRLPVRRRQSWPFFSRLRPPPTLCLASAPGRES